MALLLDEDYDKLACHDVGIEEDEAARFVVFTDFALAPEFYTVANANILVAIPENYNQAGNDMFWTHPRLIRADGQVIPATSNVGDGDNRQYAGQEYCRWSRHWPTNKSGAWRSGIDDIISIYRRVCWALKNPLT